MVGAPAAPRWRRPKRWVVGPQGASKTLTVSPPARRHQARASLPLGTVPPPTKSPSCRPVCLLVATGGTRAPHGLSGSRPPRVRAPPPPPSLAHAHAHAPFCKRKVSTASLAHTHLEGWRPRCGRGGGGLGANNRRPTSNRGVWGYATLRQRCAAVCASRHPH